MKQDGDYKAYYYYPYNAKTERGSREIRKQALEDAGLGGKYV